MKRLACILEPVWSTFPDKFHLKGLRHILELVWNDYPCKSFREEVRVLIVGLLWCNFGAVSFISPSRNVFIQIFWESFWNADLRASYSVGQHLIGRILRTRDRAHVAVHAWDELARQLNKVWFWGSKGMDWIGSSGAEKDWIGSNMLARFSMAFARMDLERVGVSKIEWNRVGWTSHARISSCAWHSHGIGCGWWRLN